MAKQEDKRMGRSERNMASREEPFSLSVDRYGRLWLHIKQDGIDAAIDLAEKNLGFEIMAAAMAENDFDHRPAVAHDGEADNDDQAH